MTDVLSGAERRRLDGGDDARFYDRPRFVHHVDEGFRDRLTRLYADRLDAGDAYDVWAIYVTAARVAAAVPRTVSEIRTALRTATA